MAFKNNDDDEWNFFKMIKANFEIECDKCNVKINDKDIFYNCEECADFDLCELCSLKNNKKCDHDHSMSEKFTTEFLTFGRNTYDLCQCVFSFNIN